ncbi:MAG: ferredoxin [Acidiferrobacterales bacterium]
MPYYRHHVFFCVNQREEGKTCCANCGSPRMREYVKAKIKAMNLAGKGRIRINMSGCLDRCEEGPIVVVYPEGIWYTYVDEQDLDEIIQEHLVHGRVVDRLRI